MFNGNSGGFSYKSYSKRDVHEYNSRLARRLQEEAMLPEEDRSDDLDDEFPTLRELEEGDDPNEDEIEEDNPQPVFDPMLLVKDAANSKRINKRILLLGMRQ